MTYEDKILKDLHHWRKKMIARPGALGHLAKKIQNRINHWIPEKVHQGVTLVMKNMVRAVLFGSRWTTREKTVGESLVAKDLAAIEKIRNYRNTAATEGALTGAGGLLLGLADFPILLALKIKLLFEIAAIYGYSTKDYKERLFVLYIFQLAFSSAEQRKKVFEEMLQWDQRSATLPEDINEFDWRTFQLEYRDYIDLAKMAQLIPIIGAPVGAVANYQLVKKLGHTAIKAYHQRWAERSGRLASEEFN